MPVDQATVLNIVCDNSACPGNDLDAHDRAGWTFVSAEVYGQTTTSQLVYCCSDCASSIGTKLDELRESSSPIEASAPAE